MADGGAGLALPARRLELEEPVEVIATAVPCAVRNRTCPHAPGAGEAADLGPQVAADTGEQLVGARRQRQPGARLVRAHDEPVAAGTEGLASRGQACLQQSRELNGGCRQCSDLAPQLVTGGVVPRDGVPTIAEAVRGGGESPPGAPDQAGGTPELAVRRAAGSPFSRRRARTRRTRLATRRGRGTGCGAVARSSHAVRAPTGARRARGPGTRRRGSEHVTRVRRRTRGAPIRTAVRDLPRRSRRAGTRDAPSRASCPRPCRGRRRAGAPRTGRRVADRPASR